MQVVIEAVRDRDLVGGGIQISLMIISEAVDL